MKKIFAYLFFTVSMTVMASAQNIAEVAMPFSAIPRNIEALATGGNTAIKSTPARLFSSYSFDFEGSYASWAPSSALKSSDINASLYKKFGSVALSFEFANDTYDSIDAYDENGTPNGSFTPKNMIVGGGFGVKILPTVSAGANVRYLSNDISSKLSAISADLLVSGQFSNFNAVAGLTSLGTKVNSFSLPTAFTAAGSYSMKAGSADLAAFAQADYYFYSAFRAGVGANCTFKDMISAQVGYNLSSDAVLPSYLSCGLGLKLKDLKLSSAFVLGDDNIGNSMIFGLGFSF